MIEITNVKTIFNIVDFEIKYGVKLNRIKLIILQRRVIYTNNLSFLTQTINHFNSKRWL